MRSLSLLEGLFSFTGCIIFTGGILPTVHPLLPAILPTFAFYGLIAPHPHCSFVKNSTPPYVQVLPNAVFFRLIGDPAGTN
jgi:hypothetical protein